MSARRSSIVISTSTRGWRARNVGSTGGDNERYSRSRHGQSNPAHRLSRFCGGLGERSEYLPERGPRCLYETPARAVVGDGAVGLLAILSAKQLGAERIIAMSRHESRQKLAREFGATDVVTERGGDGVTRIEELTQGVGADSVLECVGTAESMQQAIGAARPGGYVGDDDVREGRLSQHRSALLSGGAQGQPCTRESTCVHRGEQEGNSGADRARVAPGLRRYGQLGHGRHSVARDFADVHVAGKRVVDLSRYLRTAFGNATLGRVPCVGGCGASAG